MKKISTLLIMVLMIFLAFTGCSDGDKKPAETGGSAPVTGTATQGKVELGDGSEINYGNSQSGNNMEIPEEFPKDILPVLSDAKINHIIKNDANKGVSITFNTGNSLRDAVAFYKEVMKDGSDIQEIGGEDSHIIMGVKGDYSVAISIISSDGDSYVQIDATPQAK
jgi:hypothetical protein